MRSENGQSIKAAIKTQRNYLVDSVSTALISNALETLQAKHKQQTCPRIRNGAWQIIKAVKTLLKSYFYCLNG